MLDIKFTDINVRVVNVPLRKPIIAHLGSFDKWPFICVDIYTNSIRIPPLARQSRNIFKSKQRTVVLIILY